MNAPRPAAAVAKFAALGILIWVVNFGLFIYFYRSLTIDLLSEYWRSEQIAHIFGSVMIGYGLAAAFVAALLLALSRSGRL